MKNTRVLVLLGGDSPEREVSLHSGMAVYNALLKAGFDAQKFDTIEGFNGLDYFINKIDIVLPVLHGLNGEDGAIQRELEKRGIPYLGANSTVSSLAFDKIKTHKLLEENTILMPRYARVSKHEIHSHILFKNPYVLKPIRGGSSLDTLIAREVGEVSFKKSEELLNRYPDMIIEELISGVEITVPILGDRVLPVVAIVPPENEEFDYNNKYNDKTQELCPAPYELVSEAIQHQAKELALEVHKILSVRHISRTDFIVSQDGRIYTLELNTIPGLRPESLFPKSAKQVGISMEDLVSEFVRLVKGEF